MPIEKLSKYLQKNWLNWSDSKKTAKTFKKDVKLV